MEVERDSCARPVPMLTAGSREREDEVSFGDWLECALDALGLDAPLYARCIVSILRQCSQDSLDLSLDYDDGSLSPVSGGCSVGSLPNGRRRSFYNQTTDSGVLSDATADGGGDVFDARTSTLLCRRRALLECLRTVDVDVKQRNVLVADILHNYAEAEWSELKRNTTSKKPNDSIDSGVCPSPADTFKNYDQAFPPLSDDALLDGLLSAAEAAQRFDDDDDHRRHHVVVSPTPFGLSWPSIGGASKTSAHLPATVAIRRQQPSSSLPSSSCEDDAASDTHSNTVTRDLADDASTTAHDDEEGDVPANEAAGYVSSVWRGDAEEALAVQWRGQPAKKTSAPVRVPSVASSACSAAAGGLVHSGGGAPFTREWTTRSADLTPRLLTTAMMTGGDFSPPASLVDDGATGRGATAVAGGGGQFGGTHRQRPRFVVHKCGGDRTSSTGNVATKPPTCVLANSAPTRAAVDDLQHHLSSIIASAATVQCPLCAPPLVQTPPPQQQSVSAERQLCSFHALYNARDAPTLINAFGDTALYEAPRFMLHHVAEDQVTKPCVGYGMQRRQQHQPAAASVLPPQRCWSSSWRRSTTALRLTATTAGLPAAPRRRVLSEAFGGAMTAAEHDAAAGFEPVGGGSTGGRLPMTTTMTASSSAVDFIDAVDMQALQMLYQQQYDAERLVPSPIGNDPSGFCAPKVYANTATNAKPGSVPVSPMTHFMPIKADPHHPTFAPDPPIRLPPTFDQQQDQLGVRRPNPVKHCAVLSPTETSSPIVRRQHTPYSTDCVPASGPLSPLLSRQDHSTALSDVSSAFRGVVGAFKPTAVAPPSRVDNAAAYIWKPTVRDERRLFGVNGGGGEAEHDEEWPPDAPWRHSPSTMTLPTTPKQHAVAAPRTSFADSLTERVISRLSLRDIAPFKRQSCSSTSPTSGGGSLMSAPHAWPTSHHRHFTRGTAANPRVACANCTLTTWNERVVMTNAGATTTLVDILRMPATGVAHVVQGIHNRKSRILGDLRFIWSKAQDPIYADISDTVLSSERVIRGIESAVEGDLAAMTSSGGDVTTTDDDDVTMGVVSRLRQTHRARARRHFEQMRARMMAPSLMKFVGYVLLKIFQRLLSGLIASPSQLKQLKNAHKGEVPIIYLPLHRSHLDYLVISFVLWCSGMPLPFIASGDNLNLSGLGNLLRGLGAFFIRRRLEPEGAKQKDFVYRAVLHSYMATLLENGRTIEFFAEGTRSRTGKAVIPKSGLMAMVMQTYNEGRIADAILVPVAVTYERTLEGTYTQEQTGAPKKRESVWQVLKGIWTSMGSDYGYVKVDFGAPSSLRELMASVKPLVTEESADDSSVMLVSPTTTTAGLASVGSGARPDDTPRPLRAHNRALSDSSSGSSVLLNMMNTGGGVEWHRRLVDAVTRHQIYESQRESALTPAALLATLLLGKYRDDCLPRRRSALGAGGALLSDVAADLDWLARLAMKAGPAGGRDVVGYVPGETDLTALLQRTVALFDDNLVELSWKNNTSIMSCASSDSGYCDRDTPSSSADSRLQGRLRVPSGGWSRLVSLAYYRNAVAPAFALEAVLSATLLSYRLDMTTVWNGANDGAGGKEGVLVDDVISRAVSLANLLRHEFLFVQPCQSLEAALRETLTRLSSADFAVVRLTSAARRSDDEDGDVRFSLPSTTALESNEDTTFVQIRDDWYRPNSSAELLETFASLLMGHVECYAHLCRFLSASFASHRQQAIKESALIKNFVTEKHASEMRFAESLTTDSTRNGLKLLSERGVIKREVDGTSGVYRLVDKSLLDDTIEALAIFI